jgi:membrane-bound lytic murein transglycosylase D
MFISLRMTSLVVMCLLCGRAIAAQLAEVAYQSQQARVLPSAPADASKPAWFEDLVALPSPALLAIPAPIEVAADEAPARDVWERLRKNFGMPELSGPLVERHQAFFLKRQDILKGIIQRSRRYLYHIVSELERRKMPAELALLPMIESGYNPQALSSAQAAGLWQFIPQTGKRYELAQTTSYDARRDVVASTRAALDYLQFLYGLLGDWQLALASYNWGEESVMAAQGRNRAKGRPAHFEALVVPEETRLYVPKLQALKNIIANPEAFGITLDPLPNEPYFVAVENTRNLDLRAAAKAAEMPLDEFLALNPAFNGVMISAADTPIVLVPAEKAETFRQNLERLRLPITPKARANPARGVVGELGLTVPLPQN